MSTETDPPSDPERVLGGEPTRKFVAQLWTERATGKGGSAVWRIVGGVSLTAALGIGAWGLNAAQGNAVDHERIDRLEHDVAAMRADMTEMLRQQRESAEALARIEGRLDRPEE